MIAETHDHQPWLKDSLWVSVHDVNKSFQDPLDSCYNVHQKPWICDIKLLPPKLKVGSPCDK